jgi:hypothetical protein
MQETGIQHDALCISFSWYDQPLQNKFHVKENGNEKCEMPFLCTSRARNIVASTLASTSHAGQMLFMVWYDITNPMKPYSYHSQNWPTFCGSCAFQAFPVHTVRRRLMTTYWIVYGSNSLITTMPMSKSWADNELAWKSRGSHDE